MGDLLTVTLAAQVGRAVADHAVTLDGDEDDLIRKAMRGGLRSVTTVCGKHGEARSRVFDPESPIACGTCRTRTGANDGE